jgi:hypothetical protein
MKRVTRITVITLGVALLVVGAFVMMEALQGPTFRAADHATLEECLRNIPREWAPGSLDRSSAESACHYEMQRRGRQR